MICFSGISALRRLEFSILCIHRCLPSEDMCMYLEYRNVIQHLLSYKTHKYFGWVLIWVTGCCQQLFSPTERSSTLNLVAMFCNQVNRVGRSFCHTLFLPFFNLRSYTRFGPLSHLCFTFYPDSALSI